MDKPIMPGIVNFLSSRERALPSQHFPAKKQKEQGKGKRGYNLT
jgi:hypothetical protein